METAPRFRNAIVRSNRSGVINGGHKRTRSQRQHHQETAIEQEDEFPLESSSSCCSASHDTHESHPVTQRTSLSSTFSRRTMFASAAAALLLCSSAIITPAAASSSSPPLLNQPTIIHAFVTTPNYFSRHHNHHLHPYSRHSMSLSRKAPPNRFLNNSNINTWSNAVVRQKNDTELNESRFGVRKRVKSVLDKAKKRTGIENSSAAVSSSRSLKKEGERFNGASSRTLPSSSSSSASFVRTGADIVADTASLGGWEADVSLDLIDSVELLESDEAKHEDAGTLSKYVNESVDEVSSGVKVSSSTTATFNDGDASPMVVSTTAATDSDSSTAPPMALSDLECPEDNLVIAHSTGESAKVGRSDSDSPTAAISSVEKDALSGDVSAAFSLPREPLPFTLPKLDSTQQRQVRNGERVQYQDDMGLAGSGFVVWDVKAPASVVWDCLLDFQSYPQTIPTVREVVMYTNTHLKEDYRAEKPLDFEDGTAAICKHGVPSVTRAQFQLSKFRLKIAAVHKYRPHPNGDYMVFTLDPASTNMVLKYAKGIWHTESNPEGKEGYTRVWLLCELRVSKILPKWIVDYAAKRAMPRATTWLKPQVEAAATLWLKDSTKR